jgi:predicted molibdopterin-dependent oxidoreductase YjgC
MVLMRHALEGQTRRIVMIDHARASAVPMSGSDRRHRRRAHRHANVLTATGQFDSDFVHNYAFGFEDFIDSENKYHPGFKTLVQEHYSPAAVEAITGVPATTIYRLAGEFASNPPAVAILPGKGGLLNGSVNGLYAAMAVHMLNALVGSIEKPGGALVQRYMPVPEWRLCRSILCAAWPPAQRVMARVQFP